MMNLDYFSRRRTIRRYTDRQIPESLLKEIILKASHAPTTGNMQLYSVVVTRSAEGKKALAPMHFSQPQTESCSALLTVCADFNRFVRWCEARDAKPGYDNMHSLAVAAIDAVIFAQQICTVAEMYGLGCCYLGTTTYNASEISRILNLPPRVAPIVTLSLGYPLDDGEEAGRLPVEAIMHNETYHDYTREDIDRLYAEKEARDDSKKFVQESGKATLAQVFTDIRYPEELNREISKTLTEYLTNAYPGLK